MKIYFAGGGGGIQERELFSISINRRLLSFYDYLGIGGNKSRFLFLELLIEDLFSNSNTDKR